MSSIYDQIRATLESKLSSVAGSTYIAYENVSTHNKPDNENWLRCQLFPTSRRPACVGINPQMRYQGVWTVFCYIPEGIGPSQADDLADSIIEAFDATTDISFTDPTTSETTIVTIDYAEREQGITDQPYYYVPINVGWHLYN